MTDTVSSRHVGHVMGMPVTLVLRGHHATSRAGTEAWDEVMRSLMAVDRTFSTYRADSEVSRLNAGSLGLGAVSPDLAEVLDLGEQARVASDGAFDVWGPGHDGGRTLDPNGVVKGWAVERAARVLEALEGTDFCLSAGGDMVCRTRAPGSPGWRVGIEDPGDPSRVLAVVPVTDAAVATSGTAHRGAHLVDRRTGASPVGVASVTVITQSLTWADIDATAAYAHGAGAAHWLGSRPNRTAFVVWPDGTTTTVRTAPSAA